MGWRAKSVLLLNISTGVFKPLNDPTFFKQVYLDHGAVAWPSQIDLAPDAMYQEIKEKGVAVLA